MMNSTIKILLTEDNPADSRLVYELLKESKLIKFELIYATTLAQSFELLKQHPIDLILLDLGLMDSQGIETYRTMSQSTLNLPVIILTGLQDENIALTCIAEGAQDYFIKGTIDGPLLARAIRYAIERKHNENTINEYALIIENSNEAIIKLNTDGMITIWNTAAETLYKYSAQEMIGQSFLVLLDVANKEKSIKLLDRIMSGGSVQLFELNLLDKFKNNISSFINATAIKNKKGIIIGTTLFAHDYSQQKLSEQQGAIQLRIATVLAESSSIDNACHSILKTICEILDFKMGEIWAIDPNEPVLRYVLNWNNGEVPANLLIARQKIVLNKGMDVPGTVWATNTAYLSNDLKNDPLLKKKKLLMNIGMNCCFGFPISSEHEVTGVLLFFAKKSKPLDIRFKIMFEIVGEQLGNFFKHKRMEKELLFLSQHDRLTGLPNKLSTEDFLKKTIFQAKQNNTLVAFLYIDLDYFKNINDTLGHYQGDILLQKVALRVKNCIREPDLFARFSGDEFAVILANIHLKKHIGPIAQKILNQIQLPFLLNEQEYFITASIGISYYPAHGETFSTLFIAADQAMYQAKEKGRNNYQYATEENLNIELKRIKLETQLHHALNNKELYLCYQPIINIKTNQIESVEALLRWKNEHGTLVLPSVFVPLLEQSSLILSVGEWVLTTACEQFSDWKSYGLQTISVNVSAHQLNNAFITTIKKILKKTGLLPENLILELTESVLMQQLHSQVCNINSLNKMGLKLAIDDFGTGYSSFAYLKNFFVTFLKIDQSFIAELTTNKKSASIVEAIIVMTHLLNMQTIAEGVETKEQLDFLKKHNCDTYQGYYFSKPLPADEITELLKKQNQESEGSSGSDPKEL